MSTVEYSNFGAGLLGHVLARRAGMDYDTLVRTRVTGPLGMRHTAIALSPEMQARLAPGHSPFLEPVPNWDLPTFAGAGALRSSANDMLTFLAAALGYGSSPLDSAFATMLSTRRPRLVNGGARHRARLADLQGQGDGGHLAQRRHRRLPHVGRVRTPLADGRRRADQCRHRRRSGRHRTPSARPVIAVASEFSAAGAAEAAHRRRRSMPPCSSVTSAAISWRRSAVLTITRDGSRFFVQLTGQPAFEIFAESEKDYFLKVVDAQLTFETDAQNKAVAVVLHQNGMDQRAPRIEGEPVVPKEIAVDPAVLDGYVGGYQLTPAIVITITRQQAKLFAQLTGQPAFEVFASGERDFFYKVVNAQLTFEVDGQGRAIRRGAAPIWPETRGRRGSSPDDRSARACYWRAARLSDRPCAARPRRGRAGWLPSTAPRRRPASTALDGTLSRSRGTAAMRYRPAIRPVMRKCPVGSDERPAWSAWS